MAGLGLSLRYNWWRRKRSGTPILMYHEVGAPRPGSALNKWRVKEEDFGKPFIAISHLSGNEGGNLAMIKEYNLGWVTENPLSAGKLIREIILNPGILANKARDLEKMAARCYESGQFLREKVLEWKNPE